MLAALELSAFNHYMVYSAGTQGFWIKNMAFTFEEQRSHIFNAIS